MGKYINKPLWTTIDTAKQYSKILHSCEDSRLELLIVSAEQSTLEYLNRSYDDLIEEYGDVPAPIREFVLLIVNNSYEHLGPTEQVQLYSVPYGADFKIRPFMKL